MLWTALTHLVGFAADLVVSARRTEDAKDLEIALLRHQLRLLLRRAPRPPRLSRWACPIRGVCRGMPRAVRIPGPPRAWRSGAAGAQACPRGPSAGAGGSC